MKILGFPVPFTGETRKALLPVSNRNSWFGGIISESFSGAWQQNVEINTDTCLTFSAVYACVTLISGDIGKLGLRLEQRDGRVWIETESPSFSPVLRKPNRYQTPIQFVEQWVISKLIHGNTYVLKQRDNRGIVVAHYILDPSRVRVLISDVDGEVFYELMRDDLTGIDQQRIIVPQTEIIHDRNKPTGHPLIGVSPLTAACLAAAQGLEIQTNSANFFKQGARPGGILTAPGAISNETADRLKAYWDANFTGTNAGKIAVLGDSLKYESFVMKSSDAQMIETLGWTAENVAMAFLVPPWKIGIGTLPSYNNVQSLNVEYYGRALQTHVQAIEELLTDGLSLPRQFRVNLNEDDLLRMDTATQMDVLEKSKGKLTVNEQRRKLNQPPVEGGDTVYLQEQDHSLEWLARRDALPVEAPPPPESEPDDPEMVAAFFGAAIEKRRGEWTKH